MCYPKLDYDFIMFKMCLTYKMFGFELIQNVFLPLLNSLSNFDPFLQILCY